MDPHRSGARTGGLTAAREDSEGLWDWNLESDRIHFSPRWLALVGCEPYEVGNRPEDWFQRVHPDDSAGLRGEIETARAGGSDAFAGRYRLRHKDGSYRWMSCRGTVIRDGNDRVVRLTGSQSDVTVEMATDPLTRLPNRLLLVDRVTQSIERARRYSGFHFAVLLIDLGRAARADQGSSAEISDPVLTAVARRLETCLRNPGGMPAARDTDLVARMHGDCFAILLDGLKDVGDAKVAAERILAEILNPFGLNGREVRLSPSIGVAVSATGYTTADQMLHDAEAAQHRARVLGGSHCEIFDTAILKSEQAELQLEGDFEAALQRREFVLLFQPIVSLESTEILGFEALVRWQHPVLGMVPPLDFIPLAERTGFIVPLGKWILHEACLRLREWQTELPQSRDVSVSVNISGVQASDPALVDHVGEALRDSGLEPRLLVLELTEGVAMANPTAITTLLMRLRAMGVRISVDDFGTGYSSLAYLRQFPLDILKIDRSFVRGMVTSKDTAEIVAGLMNMARQLGLHVIAEGIEQDDQCTHLRALKCDAGQGYLFATPLNVMQAAEVLKIGLPPRPAPSGVEGPESGSATAAVTSGESLPLFLRRAGRYVSSHRVWFDVAALVVLLWVLLVVMPGRAQPASGGPSTSRPDAHQQPVTATPGAPSVPVSATAEAGVPIQSDVRSVGRQPDIRSVASQPGLDAVEKPKAPTMKPSASPVVSRTTSLDVVHLHRLGTCRGRLDVTRDGVAFVSTTDDADEAFTLRYTEFLDKLSDDTLILRSAKRTYRFKAAASGSGSRAELHELAERIDRERR